VFVCFFVPPPTPPPLFLSPVHDTNSDRAASDVWAFGVTAWETFNQGATPYSAVKDNSQLIRKILKGHRLHWLDSVPEELIELFRSCTEENPERRPTFAAIVGSFDDFEQHDSRDVIYASLTDFTGTFGQDDDALANVRAEFATPQHQSFGFQG
jgi:serine/threonine protein kinase